MNPRRAAKITLKSSKGLAHDRAIQTSVTKTQESKIFIKVVQPLSPGVYFRNFWVGMCRWDPGTLNLYQSYFS